MACRVLLLQCKNNALNPLAYSIVTTKHPRTGFNPWIMDSGSDYESENKSNVVSTEAIETGTRRETGSCRPQMVPDPNYRRHLNSRLRT